MTVPFASSAQYQYMFDRKPDKVRHSFRGDIDMLKTNVDEYKKMKQERKEEKKVSKMTINHTYKIQTRKTRKRMMASRCKAARFNGDHRLIWCPTLHKIWKHG